jgi:glycosyltransferase involved in cell wall biosynthesis
MDRLRESQMTIGLLTSAVSRHGGGVFPASCGLAKALEVLSPIRLKIYGIEDEYSRMDREAWMGLPVTAERVIGPRRFGYAPRLCRRLRSGGLDLVHTHGIWMYPSIASLGWARRERRPYIVSPHGMLDSWALERSRLRKRLAGALFENRHLEEAACLHALSPAETGSIRAYGLRNPVCVIPNGVDIPDRPAAPCPPWNDSVGPAERVLLYFGRLHPKKGLTPLLLAWSQFRTRLASRSWRLVVAGSGSGSYPEQLRRTCRALGIENSVVFVGPQYGADKAASFSRAEALILPSQSEGLPMAVLEAWAHGLPVLMTPQCNLPEGFERSAAVRIDAPGQVEIRNALEKLFWTPAGTLAAMGAQGRALAEERFSWRSAAAEMKRVYEWVLGLGARPLSVVMS